MKNIFYLAIALIFLSCCEGKKLYSASTTFKGVMFERTFPFLDFDTLKNKWIVLRYDPFYTKIFTYENLTIIQSNYYYQTLTHPTEALETKEFSSKYYSFIFSEQTDMGVLYDSTNFQTARIVSRDSMLNKEWALKIDQERYFLDNEYKLISSDRNSEKEFIEKYYFKNKKDTTLTGNLQFIFSDLKLPESKYSLSRRLEEKRRMKLVKTISTSYARRIGTTTATIDEVEVIYEMKEVEGDKAELLKLLNYAKLHLIDKP